MKKLILFLLFCPLAFAQTTVTNIPSTGSAPSGSSYWTPGGCTSNPTQTWSSPANVGATGTSTFASMPGVFCGLLAVQDSPPLVGNSFGFSIPSSATINGVAVTFQRWQNSSGGVASLQTANVYLCNSTDCSTTIASKPGNGTPWPGSSSISSETYGSSSDLWGVTLTPSIINSASFSFGVTIAVETSGGSYDPSANSFSMAVTYTGTNGVRHTVFWPAKFIAQRKAPSIKSS